MWRYVCTDSEGSEYVGLKCDQHVNLFEYVDWKHYCFFLFGMETGYCLECLCSCGRYPELPQVKVQHKGQECYYGHDW